MKTKFIIFFLILIFLFWILFSNKNICYKNIKYKENFEINFPLEKGLYTHNSSIIKENENYIVYSRISSYTYSTIFNYLYYAFVGKINITGMTKFDKNFNIISQEILDIDNMLEDLRVFSWNNKKYFIGSIKYLESFYPILLSSDFKKIDILDQNNEKYHNNKNFAPIIVNNDLFLVKNHNPLEILKCIEITNKYIKTKVHYSENLKKIPKIRGSTPYINIGSNKFLGITHDVMSNNWIDKTYRHYFTIINFTNINMPFIEKVSLPICLLGDCGIEFVMGFIESYNGKDYIITLGKNDCTSHIITINKDEILKYF